MRLNLPTYILWFVAPALQVGVLAAMCKRNLQREYPFFFGYTVFSVVNFVIAFSARHSALYYFRIYWSMSALGVLISFAVLSEIFKDAFRPYEALRDLSVILFRWCALVVLLVAGMWAITSANSSQSAVDLIMLTERSVRLMQCGLVFFLLLFSEYLGISRRHVLFGIALGFGFFAAVDMLVVTAWANKTVISKSALRLLQSGAYDVSALIWLGYTALPALARSHVKAAAEATQKWNLALEDARATPAEESVLDTMDRTVEQLLYHRGEKVKVAVTER